MLLSTRILTALAAALPLVAALPQQPSSDYCASDAGENTVNVHKKLVAGEASVMKNLETGQVNLLEAAGLDASSIAARQSGNTPMVFNTYVHIIQSAAGTSPASGYISRQQIDAQMRVLNQEYAIANVAFNYVNTSYTVNSRWANAAYPGDSIESEMKPRLRVGGRLDLNLFYIPGWRGSGVCRFPNWIGRNDEYLSIDGCMQASDSFPDGTRNRRGFLTVHEVGHWVGLLHTFQGGCNGGDQVADTPAEATPNRETYCPTNRDTCPNHPGYDPIENHMDYSLESCKTGFTRGQAERLRQMVLMYRYARN
ncbi:metalloprotease MEP1-like protein [Cordyceps fumosorosea ARSEF 2679]|uniref:Metalloprotease MEP1-like protein n=1 Tax=Cordyceps fumosorosea (strain ARSEF 2679) TaxID=1081104 RepID=A0A168DGY6_CORFA|nr:metalloprotease MEP1-like protein [Cordyceps fumosorosea ARSEF 2679]OAA72606.1 metalloprotease MEP1-like protein [Cordyceps fumosorosea ARSEF 2679]